MAEILGIVANVAALIQLAHYGEKFAKALLNFSKQNSSPRKEVDRCASQAQDFSDCINMTHFTLERHFANFTKSPLLQYLSSQGILDRILNRSKSIEWQLDKATIRVRSLLGGGNAVFNFLKWWYQKDSILDLFPEMNSVKISLQLLVSATQLEVLDMECKDSLWDTEKLISNEKHMYVLTNMGTSPGVIDLVLNSLSASNHLKKVIRGNLKTLKRLEAQIERANPLMPTDAFTHQTQSTSSLYEIMLPLGRSMVKTGSVPKPKFVSSESSESSTRTKEVISHIQNNLVRRLMARPQTYKSSTSGNSMPSVSSAPSRGASSQTEARHYDHEALYKLERRLQHERLSRKQSSSAKTTPSSTTGQPATKRHIDHGSGANSNIHEAKSVQASQSQRQQLEPLHERVILVDTANLDRSIVHSHVLHKGKLTGKILTGVVHTTLDVSVISILEAKRLDINVDSCEDDKKIGFKFDQGTVQTCIGMVSITIDHNPSPGSQSLITRHKFYVLENCHPRLIYGKDIWEIEETSKQ
ncbi:hypothetical protein CABS03_04009 [Colletotrichum abscissum]|uniref:Uncharacterized protein n=1 Tax=Colletotrichum abscissum TaxID=1671311 RepID=A0A9P9XAE3_9PEZI|nr:hypothetical protein CABS02_09405 [Colletotrichum abscissum]